MIKKCKFLIYFLPGLFVFSVNIVFSQDLSADLLRNNGTICARLNKYDPSRYNYLVGRKSVELGTAGGSLEFEGSKWEVTKDIKPLEKAG
jgi:hypothetical protein